MFPPVARSSLLLLVVVFFLLFDTTANRQTDQHTKGDTEAGIVAKLCTDDRAEAHSKTHTFRPVVAVLLLILLFLYVSANSEDGQ